MTDFVQFVRAEIHTYVAHLVPSQLILFSPNERDIYELWQLMIVMHAFFLRGALRHFYKIWIILYGNPVNLNGKTIRQISYSFRSLLTFPFPTREQKSVRANVTIWLSDNICAPPAE